MKPSAPGALWIKVCGLRSAEAIDAAARAGADAVGFVFHEPSPRHLAPAAARALAASVPPGLDKVAVFLHPSQQLVDEAIAAVRPDWVQVDMTDLPRLRIGPAARWLPVLRTGAAADGGNIDLRHFERVLLESGRSGEGERADWSEAARIAATAPVVLAGGLDASNVAEAIAAVRPAGVDVSSGVERARGVKDKAMIEDFVKAVRAAETRLAQAPSLGVPNR